MRRILRNAPSLGWLVVALCVGDASLAQDVRPGDERPELPAPLPEEEHRPSVQLPSVPSFSPEEEEPGDALPRLPLPGEADLPGVLAERRVEVREVRITGNTVLDPDALRGISTPYVGRAVSFSEIQSLRDSITQAYIDAGYVTSGAVLEGLQQGVLQFRVVEGILAGPPEIETDGRLSERLYLQPRVNPGDGPLDVNELQARLQRLQQDERIRSVDAQLVPTDKLGESRLRVAIEEANPWRLVLGGDNYGTPSIGEWQGTALVGHRNVTGLGDALVAEYKGGEGLNDVRGYYDIPITPWDTRLNLSARATWSEIIEDPFDELDIESETQTYGIGLHQPVYQTLNHLVELFVRGEYRRSESFLLGQRFSFVVGPDEGVAKLAVLRGGLEWTYRSPEQVLALRAFVSNGIDALGATHTSRSNIPDGQFVSGLVQLQWARRLPVLDIQIVARGDAQLAERPLLGLEQFSIGGHASVRGYRENEVVRDNGAVGSVELRVPVPLPRFPIPRLGYWRPTLALVPFFDAGFGWNESRSPFPTAEDQELLSAGIGARVGLAPGVLYEVYWADAFNNVPEGGETSLQDRGWHMGLTVAFW